MFSGLLLASNSPSYPNPRTEIYTFLDPDDRARQLMQEWLTSRCKQFDDIIRYLSDARRTALS